MFENKKIKIKEELKTIVKRSARVLNLNIDDKAAEIIAKRSRRLVSQIR